jgi:hypothetical protein
MEARVGPLQEYPICRRLGSSSPCPVVIQWNALSGLFIPGLEFQYQFNAHVYISNNIYLLKY